MDKGDGSAAYGFKRNAVWLILFTVYQPGLGYRPFQLAGFGEYL